MVDTLLLQRLSYQDASGVSHAVTLGPHHPVLAGLDDNQDTNGRLPVRLIGKAVRFTDDPQKLDQGALAKDEAHDEDASLVPVLEKVEPPNVQLRIVISVIYIVEEDKAPKHKKSR